MAGERVEVMEHLVVRRLAVSSIAWLDVRVTRGPTQLMIIRTD